MDWGRVKGIQPYIDKIIHFRQPVVGHIVKTPIKEAQAASRDATKRERESLSIRAN